ncbi:MAG: hypothetical protein ABL933_13060 [Methyloglobulus sp.]|nr:hypothetical protein [Methyloglobulus sp.]
MKIPVGYFFWFAAIALTCYLLVGFAQPAKVCRYKLTRLFPASANTSALFDDSIIASSLLDVSQGRPLIIVPVANGLIAALDGESGDLAWQFWLPTPKGQQAQLISTPVQIGNRLVVLYQCLEKNVRISHRLVVIDLSQKKLDPSFPVLTLSAEKQSVDGNGTVTFNASTAFSHAAVKHARRPGSAWGTVYVAFGNSADTQPFHGWMFEIDMDAWQKQGAQQAISHVLLTTPEAKCPVTLESGTQEMICGGGIWSPAGPLLFPSGDSYELIVPTGNGQIDLARHDYANTLMRVQPDLSFDPACDEALCRNFNPSQPDEACMASCKNLFIPRLPSSDTNLKPANHECDDKTFSECLAWMDYDLGGSSPVKVGLNSGHSVLVQPGKDGAVYLIDANHLGTQYDRLQIVDVCGTAIDPCKAGWMGMIVTQPTLTYIDKIPVVVIPTFVPDKTHPAGLVALKITVEEGVPRLQPFWRFPDPKTKKAVQTFRSHPSFPVITTLGKNADAVVWVLDIGATGTLYGVRIKDGQVMAEQSLLGAGRPLSTPLIVEDTIYLASILPSTGKALLEAYRIDTEE